jgi:hypothetical protein
LRHLDSSRIHTLLLTASRFVAASTARNEFLLHIDDDILPTDAMLRQLLCYADRAIQSGEAYRRTSAPVTYAAVEVDHTQRSCDAPHCAAGATAGRNTPIRASSPELLVAPLCNARLCGHSGYDIPSAGVHVSHLADGIVLTKLALATRAINEQYLAALHADGVGSLLRATKGNGEDILYAMFARTLRVRQHALSVSRHGSDCGWIEPLHRADAGVSGRSTHFIHRTMLCRCLSRASESGDASAATGIWLRHVHGCVASTLANRSRSG